MTRAVLPAKADFVELAQKGVISPVYIGPADQPCGPAEAYQALRRGPYSFLLESVRPDPRIGRYSFVGSEPYMVFRSRGRAIEVVRGETRAALNRPPLVKLRELMENYRTVRVPGMPPFAGGCAGFFSYDFVHNFEKLSRQASDDLGIPEAYFVFVDAVAAFDHVDGKLWLIACPGASGRGLGYTLPEGDGWADAYDRAVDKLRDMEARLASAASQPIKGPGAASGGIKASPLIPKERYMEMVSRAKEYIAAGDIFQANLSQRLSADVDGVDPWEIYKVLREVNPSPFASFMDFPDVKIVSSSPERLVRLADGVADTRPIAGTRPRGKDRPGDDAMRSELLLNEKERAEHIMLIDLERNDLGRVCDYGSVHVDELMVTEDYSHVIHIVSNVTGRLAPGRDAFDLIKATFPGGTITGVPKVRCMEIIDELEPVARGPYTGSAGYISHTGDMDLNIVIRTFVIKDGRAYVQAGAGIVADSDPEREYYETLHKAEALVRTLERL
ncbi:MAG: anthranilate synthase component I family protein [Nitrospirae bacterium]|nr:anthranilate synthase component I family protein [Nitrospirota bacterium]